jgi:hypothetical protein
MTLSSSLWAYHRLVVVEKRSGGRIRRFERFGESLYFGGRGMLQIFDLTMRETCEAATLCSRFVLAEHSILKAQFVPEVNEVWTLASLCQATSRVYP